tara:strand:+ start:472 stop:777 length:306 start_codon:yes stop_codon:yes gene_type:complete
MGKLNKLLHFHQPSKCRKGGRGAGYIPYTDENMKHIAWCLNNKISVSVVPNWDTARKWMVEIKIKNKVNTDPVDYTDEEALIKMYEYYKYYYDKYNENKIL